MKFRYVDTPEGLQAAAAILRAADRLAVDTEADSLHHYFEKTCLIQISTGKKHILIDTLSGLDWEPLFEAMAEKKLVLHGADYDLRLFRRNFSFHPRIIFDTALAAQLLGYPGIGLAALMLKHFEIEMPKSSQRADWSKRPLSAKMLDYAVGDVCRLLELADILEAELRQIGRLEWAHEASARLIEDSTQDREVDPDRRWRIRGWNKLDGRPQAILRELWTWREAEGAKADRPTFKIINNEMLLKLAQWAHENPQAELREFSRLPRSIRGGRVRKLRLAMKKGIALPESKWPQTPRPKGRRFPERLAGRKLDGLRKSRNKIAESLGIECGVLVSNSALSAIATDIPRDLAQLRATGRLLQWQAAVVGEVFLEILSREDTAGD